MISTFPSKLRKFNKLHKVFVSLHDRAIHTNFAVITDKKWTRTVTSVDPSARCLSITTNQNSSRAEMDGAGDRNLELNYAEIIEAQKDPEILIVDVREDSEIQETGKLPGSIHIPMGDVSNLLSNLSSQEFEKKFDRKKPTHSTKIILSCRSGRRSAMVQSEIQKLGYNNAYNYSGGWLDWEEKQKA